MALCSTFLGALAKLRKATISFVMSVCLSVRPRGTIWLLLNGFSWTMKFKDFFFENLLRKLKDWLICDKNNGFFTWRPLYIYGQHLAEFFLEWKMFQTKVVEKITTHVLCSITCFWKSCRLWDNGKKYGTAGQATDENIIRRMRIACWITKSTNTHSEYVTLNDFTQHKWLRERAPVLSCYKLN